MFNNLKTDLKRVRPVLMHQKFLAERLELLRDACIPTGPVSGFGRQHSVDVLERRVIEALDCETELKSYYDTHNSFLSRMDRTVRSLEDSELALLIELRYYKGCSWGEVARTLCYSEVHVYRLHAKALKLMLPIYDTLKNDSK